jgi:predicted O-methyltransferase YrrM
VTEPVDVDTYLAGLLVPDEPVVDSADLPPIAVSAVQGKLLSLLARAIGARRVLEVGTLAGYSALWLARGLPPDGTLVTLEYDPHHAEVARANIARAGLSSVVTVVVGAAVETLPTVVGPFDLVFVDADKPNNPVYVDWAARLLRPGGVLVLDNVVRGGEVADAASTDERVVGTRAALEAVANDPRLDATALQMVGAKGWDGFLLALRT